ncbi:peptide deformylase [soil metagenome]
MTIHPIRIVGDPVLRQVAAAVTAYDDVLRQLVEDMMATMRAANGVGLAAPQIGLPRRVFVYECPDDTGTVHSGHVVNPVLRTGPIPKGLPDPDHDVEGCLSVPGEHFPTNRAEHATVTGRDATGEPLTVVGSGLLAVCLQHESDHLNGLLYLDRLTGRYKREARRMLKANGWADGDPRQWLPGLDPDPFGH